MKIAKTIYTFICDDIRQEINNKISLMGIYQNDIVIDKIPTVLPTLSFMIILEGLKASLSGTEIIIKLPNIKTTLLKVPETIKNKSKTNSVRLLAKMTPFRINTEGEVKIQLKHPELPKIKTIYTFNIINKINID